MQLNWLIFAIGILALFLFYPQLSMWFQRQKRIREGRREDEKIRREMMDEDTK